MSTEDLKGYKTALSIAEKKLKNIQNIPDNSWNVVHTTDTSTLYTHVTNTMTYKLKKILPSNEINLDLLMAAMTTVEVRTQWCHWFSHINTLAQPAPNINIIHAKVVNQTAMLADSHDIVWAEQCNRGKNRIQYLATSFSTINHENPTNYFFTCDIHRKFDMATVTLCYQWDKIYSTSRISSMLSELVNDLLNIDDFPWIIECDQGIKITNTVYGDDYTEFEYTYSESEDDNIVSAVDIMPRIHYNNSDKWQSSSWDRDITLNNDTNNYMVNMNQPGRKSKFMTSSSVFSSAVSSPLPDTIMTSSSYPDNTYQWTIYEEDEEDIQLHKTELRIGVSNIPHVYVSLPSHIEWSEKYAQVCIRCYQRPHDKKGYIIQLIHPSKLMQYFKHTHTLDVKLTIKKADTQVFCVNDKEWPIRSWTVSSDEEDILTDDKEEEDIFVDGMEQIDNKEPIIQTAPVIQPIQPEPIVPSTITTKPEKDTPLVEHISIPETDPPSLKSAFIQFNALIDSSHHTIIQLPNKENGNVIIKKVDVPGHPIGAFISESTWQNCSIWDIKAIIESPGARKVWDTTFEKAILLHDLTPTSSIWHTKLKGAWPVSPRDYVCLHGHYLSDHRINLLSTSCTGESYQRKPLPKDTPGYIRATMDVMGWQMDCVDSQTVSFKHVLLTQFSSWVMGYLISRTIVQTAASIQHAYEYLEKHGAPPNLISLNYGLLVTQKYHHEKKNWRCEYVRRMDGADNTKETDKKGLSQSTSSVIRMDKRRWAGKNNHYSVIIDPPPSHITALQKTCDPYGVWLTVEHDEAFIIPLGGKILVLIKPDDVPDGTGNCQLNINGAAIIVDEEPNKSTDSVEKVSTHQILTKIVEMEDKKKEASRGVNESTEKPAVRKSSSGKIKTFKKNREILIGQAMDKLLVSPKEHAQAAMTFLKQSDEQFGWTVVSENSKTGIRISKRPGSKNVSNTKKKDSTALSQVETSSSLLTKISSAADGLALEVPDPYTTYKGSMVIENYSLEEIVTVISDVDSIRRAFDDSIEKIEAVRKLDYGCRIVRQRLKAVFPFKTRETYVCTCLAEELPTLPSSSKRTLYIESSLPGFPEISAKYPKATLFISGWILEPIDPYTTTINHPIPSTRVTYVAALDLGVSIPAYVSNLIVSSWFPKKLQSVENYLKTKGPPPLLNQPFHAFTFSNNALSLLKDVKEDRNGFTWDKIESSYDDRSHVYKLTTRLTLLDQNGPTPTKKVYQEKEESKAPTIISSPVLHPSPKPLKKNHPGDHSVTGNNTMNKPIGSPQIPRRNTIDKSKKERQTTTSSISNQVFTFMESVLDVRAYPKGYEMQAYLYNVTDEDETKKRKDISSKLTFTLSELSLSHVIEGKSKHCKHNLLIKAQGLSPHILPSTYELEFELTPLKEETFKNRPSRLTVLGALGADENKDKWNGVVMMNGVEAEMGSEMKLESKNADNESVLSSHNDLIPDLQMSEDHYSPPSAFENDHIQGRQMLQNDNASTMQYISGGVMAAAFGNVTAGVNNLGARMIFPFNSFLNNNRNEDDSTENSGDESAYPPRLGYTMNADEHTRRDNFWAEAVRNGSFSSHEVRLLRKSSDTMRKGIFLLFICLALGIIFALLLLQPMIERYYTSLLASSTISNLDSSVEQGMIRRLIQIPWFGGWDIQIIAIKQKGV